MVQEGILSVAHVDETCIQVGHDFPYAADIDVAHGILHVPTVTVQLHELTVFENGKVNALRR